MAARRRAGGVMPIMNVEEFLQVLQKSTLLSPQQIQTVRQEAAGVTDPKVLARKLLAASQLTKWQALQLLHGRTALTMGPYKLLEQSAGDNVARTFVAQHEDSGRKVELRALSRSHAGENPEAVQQFLEAAEQTAAAENRKLVEVHRPDTPDDTCYVILEKGDDAVPRDASVPSDPAAAKTATKDATAATQTESEAKEDTGAAPETSEQPTSAAAQVGPPKLKARAAPTTAAPGPAAKATDAAAPQDESTEKDKPAAEIKDAAAPQEKPTASKPAAKTKDAAAPQEKPTAKDKPAAHDKPKPEAPTSPATKPAEEKPAMEIKLPEEGATTVPAVSARELKIAVGKRRKKPPAAPVVKPAKPAKAEAAEGAEAIEDAEAASDEQVELAAPSGRWRSPAVLIGGAVAGGVLLLVAGVALTWLLFFRGSDHQVADAQGTMAAAQAADAAGEDGAATPHGDASSPEVDPPDPVSDPEVIVEVVPAASAEPKPQVEPAAEPDADAKPAAPAEAAPEKTEGTAVAEAKDAKPSDAPAGDKPETVAKADSPEAEPAAEMESTKPKASEEKPTKDTEEKTEADKPADKKPTGPPPAKKPFADLKGLAMLPGIDSDQPQRLGLVHIPPGELCFVRLRGGDKALRGPQQFAMRNAEDGLAERAWEISIREGASGTETVIAALAVDDKSQFVFQWKPAAKSPELENISPHLRNCVFSLACAGESQVVRLRAPESAEPFSVDLDRAGGGKDQWRLEHWPDPEFVRFQITGVSGAKFSVDPEEPQPAEKSTVWLRIEEGGGLLSLKIDANLRRDFQLTAAPHIKLDRDAPKPDKFVRRMFQDNLKKAEATSQQMTAVVEEMQKFTKSNKPEGERKKVQQRLPALQLDANNMAALVKNMQRIDEFLDKVKGGMQIQFRVFFDADGTDVELLKAGG